MGTKGRLVCDFEDTEIEAVHCEAQNQRHQEKEEYIAGPQDSLRQTSKCVMKGGKAR